MANSKPERDASPEEVAEAIETQIAGLDPQRAEALEGLQKLRAARGIGYVREQKRLALKYGADSPRVAELAEKARFNKDLSRDLAFEITRAKTDTPVVDENGYVLHGFVLDRQGQPIPRLTVAVYDTKGTWIRVLGHGCTDEHGYFILRYSGGEADLKERDAMVITPSAAAAQPRPSARIYVLDAKGTTLHIEEEPLEPQLGEIDFRVIILGDESEHRGLPPESRPNEPPPKLKSTDTGRGGPKTKLVKERPQSEHQRTTLRRRPK
jgi:hypothetical protein